MSGDILVVKGKGKTNYALCLCIKAAGAGNIVFLGQFIKGSEYSEIKALKRLDDLIVVEQFGLRRFLKAYRIQRTECTRKKALKEWQLF